MLATGAGTPATAAPDETAALAAEDVAALDGAEDRPAFGMVAAAADGVADAAVRTVLWETGAAAAMAAVRPTAAVALITPAVRRARRAG